MCLKIRENPLLLRELLRVEVVLAPLCVGAGSQLTHLARKSSCNTCDCNQRAQTASHRAKRRLNGEEAAKRFWRVFATCADALKPAIWVTALDGTICRWRVVSRNVGVGAYVHRWRMVESAFKSLHCILYMFTNVLGFKVFCVESWEISKPLGCPKITPNVKCLAPEAFSGAKLQVFMENGQKNEID